MGDNFGAPHRDSAYAASGRPRGRRTTDGTQLLGELVRVRFRVRVRVRARVRARARVRVRVRVRQMDGRRNLAAG